jgi:thiol-disulfide isomerase/thioredoxin
MKKIIIPAAIIGTLLLSSCTLPWQKKETTPDTETVIEDTGTGSTDKATTPPPAIPEVPKDITPSDTPKAIAPGGVYLPYTSTAVAQAKGQVVLFFHANWCPTCIAVNKDIEANLKNIPADLTILKTSYDDEKELKELYGVTAQHTFVQVDNTGKLIKKWRGGTTLAEVTSQVQK